jgi:hypothetical protein
MVIYSSGGVFFLNLFFKILFAWKNSFNQNTSNYTGYIKSAQILACWPIFSSNPVLSFLT